MNTIGAILVAGSALVWGGQQETSVEVKAVVAPFREVNVPAREQGVLAEVSVEEGERITAGDRLAQIDDADAQLERQRADIDLKRSRDHAKNTVKIRLGQKKLELAELELRRALDARKRFPKSVSDTEISQHSMEVDKANLELEQAQREFDIYQHNLKYAENELAIASRGVARRAIVAPLSGIVVQIHHRAGEWVRPGETVVRVLRTDRVRIEGFVDAGNLDEIAAGRAVQFRATLGGQEMAFKGVLRFVSPEVDTVDDKARVWAEVNNADGRLRPGMRGVLRLEVNSSAAGE